MHLLNVSLRFALGNSEILGKQNQLFSLGSALKCLLSSNMNLVNHDLFITVKIGPFYRLYMLLHVKFSH